MSFFRRLTLAFGLAFCASMALAAVAIAQKGGGPPPQLAPGKYVFTGTFASSAFGDPTSGTLINISVTRSLDTFRPEEEEGGSPPTSTNTDEVFLQISNPAPVAIGCFLIPRASDFSVSKDLQNAALHTTLTAACPSPFPAGLPLPVTLDVTWTGLGVVNAGHDHSNSKCAKYTTETTITSGDASATASGTVSAPNLPPVSFNANLAGLHSTNVRTNVDGTPNPACVSGGKGARGAGPGPLAPGKYALTGISANSVFGDPTNGNETLLEISATRILNTFRPEKEGGSPPTANHTDEVFLFLRSQALSGGGCFLLPRASDFSVSKDLQSAALHTTLTTECPSPFPSGLPLPITLDVTWTGIGVVNTGHDQSNSKCAKYTTETTTTTGDANATASGTVSVPTMPHLSFAATPADVHSINRHIKAHGIANPACFSGI